MVKQILINFPEILVKLVRPCNLAFFLEFFSWGGGAESIVMQISSVMLLFSDQISGRSKNFQGGKLPQGGRPLTPLWKEADNICLYQT